MLIVHWWTIVIGSLKKWASPLIEIPFPIVTSKLELGRTHFHDSTYLEVCKKYSLQDLLKGIQTI